MLFSRDWLGDYTELPDDPAELARLLTAGGFAVESLERLGEDAGGDVVLDVDVTTNRPDAMCHAGLAREAAVLGNTSLRLPEPALEEGPEAAADLVRVEIDDPDLASRYVARVVRGVTVGPSPEWLARRLRAIGVRPINNVVDVTNYVLWELGQPLHAFDLEAIAGGEIRVRRAAAGERLVTLDGEERELDPETLVIADAERPVALAGVMGGLDTEVTGATTDVLLESAWFEPRAVRRTARRFGLHTDASHRFERGADPSAQARAAERAAALVAELAGGTVAAGAVDAVAREHPERTLELDLDRLDAFAGAELPRERIPGWFEGLGFEVAADGSSERPTRLTLTVPPWRLFDVEETADLYEEPLRIHGFDEIPATLPAIAGSDGPATERQRLRATLRRRLAAAGHAEAIDFAFHSREAAAEAPGLLGRLLPDAGLVPLANPLSELYAVLRASLLPGLLASARFNLRRNAEAVRLYELGVVFSPGPDGTVVERELIALLAGGTVGSPWQGRHELDFFDVKGIVEELAATAGRKLEARPPAGGALPGFVEGAAAEIWPAGADGGEPVGVLGRLDVEAEGGAPLFAAELALDALESGSAEGAERTERPVEVPPRLPGIDVDLTLTHPLDVPWAEIAAAVEAERPPELARYALVDRYRGEGVPAGAVNTTIAFHYHGGERQLTHDVVNELHTALSRHLEERFGRRDDENDHEEEASR